MATQQNGTPAVKQALLFMPDISGFTKFVNETEILHSQHIIQELLEILVDSNKLKLQVSEIEGDAIFFFRPGEKPSLDELLHQVETMYINFHRHLKLYDHQRICICGACQSAISLKLKIIAHYGEVAEYSVKEHNKLFGRDVILIHRLLKNNIDSNEYILLTDSLGNDAVQDRSWLLLNRGSENYDAGEVQFSFSVLDELGKNVPPPDLPHFNLASKSVISFVEEKLVAAEMQKVFGTIANLEDRTRWMEGVQAIEMMDHDKINRVGAHHRCIVNPKDTPIIITESASMGKDKMELVEMVNNGMGGCRFKLQETKPGETLVRAEMLVSKKPVVRAMFNLLMRNKYKKKINRSLSNLKALCEKIDVVKTEPAMI